MKKIVLVIFTILAIFLFNTCALEIANVIGPDGGYVFYDKGSYNYGWRYIQCSPYDFGELNSNSTMESMVNTALSLCRENNANWHKFGWELPDEGDLRKMLECFSYGLTRFSPRFYYLAVNNLYIAPSWWICVNEAMRNQGNFCTTCGDPAPPPTGWVRNDDEPPNPDFLADPSVWEIVILHKNFDNHLNGIVERVDASSISESIRVRAIRRF